MAAEGIVTVRVASNPPFLKNRTCPSTRSKTTAQCSHAPRAVPMELCAVGASNPVVPSAKCAETLKELTESSSTAQPLSRKAVQGREPITVGKSPVPAPLRLIQNSTVQLPAPG